MISIFILIILPVLILLHSWTCCVYIQPLNPPITTVLNFDMVGTDFIASTIKSMNTTNSILDPLPCSVIKNCLETVSPHIAPIVNLSLSSGVPQSPKSLW